MKLDKLFLMLLCVGVCLMLPKKTIAAPVLDLWMTGDFTWDSNDATWRIEAKVHRTNTDFGLGGLSYNLQFSETLPELTREYSNYGWDANDGIFDMSNPVDPGSGGRSEPGSYLNIRFDTVADPVGSEFTAGTSGIVEDLISPLIALTPRWIYFDLLTPSASDGLGQDLVATLGGSINFILDPNPLAPESGHMLAVYVPEPATLMLIGLGGVISLRKRRAQS